MSKKIRELCERLIKEFRPRQLAKYSIFLRRKRLLIFLILSFLYMWFSIGINIYGFIIALFLYFILINVAFSDFTEKLLRAIEDTRNIATFTEKERLNPLFKEVYKKVKKRYKYIGDDVKLYLIDTISISSMAIGRNTIIISRGILETMNDEEIKGILSHEFAHIVNDDTQISILISLCSGIYLWLLLVLNGAMKLLENSSDESNSFGNMVIISRKIIGFSIQVYLLIWNLILGKASFKKEYKADLFSMSLNYGNGLLSVLYKLYHMQISDKKYLFDRVQSSHPRIAYRIERLEEK